MLVELGTVSSPVVKQEKGIHLKVSPVVADPFHRCHSLLLKAEQSHDMNHLQPVPAAARAAVLQHSPVSVPAPAPLSSAAAASSRIAQIQSCGQGLERV